MTRVRDSILWMAAVSLACGAGGAAHAGGAKEKVNDAGYVQTNLISDIAGANATDANLKNPWGIAFVPGSPFWIAANGTGVAVLSDGQGNVQNLVVTIPPPGGAPQGTTATPTGIVWNFTQGFGVGDNGTAPATFLFATEDGTISGWNPTVNPTNAILKIDASATGSIFKGLALAPSSKGVLLYATNFHAGTVDVWDNTFKRVTVDGGFVDPNLPPGYAPFGITAIDGDLFVTYALQDADKADDVAGPGHGFVDIFDTDGHLLRRFASAGALNSPWGVTRTPYGFGRFSGDVLVGNFGDGHISAYSSHGEFLGQLSDTNHNPIVIDGLWGLKFGGGLNSTPETLYFAAGINDEANGLFGTLTAAPLQ